MAGGPHIAARGHGRHERAGGHPQVASPFIDSLLVRIHFIIIMIWWTGLAPCEFVFPFPGTRISTFLVLFLLLLSAASQRRRVPPLPSPRARVPTTPISSSVSLGLTRNIVSFDSTQIAKINFIQGICHPLANRCDLGSSN